MKNFKILTLLFLVSALLLTGCAAGTPAASTEPVASAVPAVSSVPAATAVSDTSAAPQASADQKATGNAADGTLVLTLDELSAYNGENGNPAYIAVEGVIYDVTNVPQWRNGKHNGFTAGKDLTNEIKTISPHGTSKLKGVPVVGKIAP